MTTDTFFTGHVTQGGLFGDDAPLAWTVIPSRLRNLTPTTRKPVIGTYSATRRCDDRCTSARGHICICSCGGKNHGRGWQ